MENIIIVNFSVESEAYQALTELKANDEQVNKNHYYYQVETNQDKEKYQDYYNAIDKKMPVSLK